MSDEELDLVATAHAARRLSFKAREFIFLEDDLLTDIYVIDKGSVRLANYSRSGRERTIFTLGPRQMFGEFNFCTGTPAVTVAQATGPSEIVRLPRTEFGVLLSHHPHLYRVLAASLAYKVGLLHEQTRLSTFAGVRERLIGGLHAVSEAQLGRRAIGAAIELDITQQELANLVGAHRVTVSRLLKQLERERLVDLDRGRLRFFPDRSSPVSSTSTQFQALNPTGRTLA